VSGLEVVVLVFGMLAAIGWSCAWQTMHWLVAAEDLIEYARARDHEAGWAFPLDSYERHTPRRPT
jgi:hypothetical protein